MNRSPYTWTSPASKLVAMRWRRMMAVMIELGCADGVRPYLCSYFVASPTYRA